jgi:hypothetical protein
VDEEEVLPGGNLGGAVRVGGTVRRPVGPWTPAVHALLRHLESAGFEAAPRVLGIDDRGREVLTFIPGETAEQHDPWPAWVWSDAALVQTGELLRRCHDAVRDFTLPDATWRFTSAPMLPGQIICHNDWAPYNVVWRDGRIVGVIDWDVAGPGDPRQDLAFAAWQWIPMHHPSLLDGDPPDIASRLATLCRAYGLEDLSGFVPEIPARAQASVDRILRGADAGDPSLIALRDDGYIADLQRSVAYMESIAPGLARTVR